MYDLSAVVSDSGITLYFNFMTDEATRDGLLRDLGGIRDTPNTDRIFIHYGNGLTKEHAIKTLRDRNVRFELG